MKIVTALNVLCPGASWSCSGDSYSGIQWNDTKQDIPSQEMINLFLEADGQPLGSTECQLLKEALTPSQWLAYQAIRNSPITAKRQEQYRINCDPLYLSLVEQSTKNNTPLDLSSWIAAKESVREQFPYLA